MKSCYRSLPFKPNRKVFNLTMCWCRLILMVLYISSTSDGQPNESNNITVVPSGSKELNTSASNNSSESSPKDLVPTSTLTSTLTSKLTSTLTFTATNRPTASLTTVNQDVAKTTDMLVRTTADNRRAGKSPAYLILGMMIVVIIVLIIILYMLRRSSRKYSFDLHPQSSASHLNQPEGTFDPILLDDLGVPELQEREWTSSSVLNGITDPTEAQYQSSNGLPVSDCVSDDVKTDLSTGLLDDGDLLVEMEEQREVNGNNNNPFCSTDSLFEINLDEPVCSGVS